MPNDAKLGLIVGVGVVLAVATVFFRKENPGMPATPDAHVAVAVPADSAEKAIAANSNRPLEATQTSQVKTSSRSTVASRRHTVKDGETLPAIAELYYGDKEKSSTILKANPEVLKTAEKLQPGIDLLIPDVSERP